MRVVEISRLVQVTPDTVRYYTRIGFLKPIKNKTNGYKEYSQLDVSRLRFIANAKRLGFSLTDIQKIIREAGKGKTACPLVRQLIEQRLVETEQQFQEIRRLRKRMQQAVNTWGAKPDKAPSGHEICHLIESFSEAV